MLEYRLFSIFYSYKDTKMNIFIDKFCTYLWLFPLDEFFSDQHDSFSGSNICVILRLWCIAKLFPRKIYTSSYFQNNLRYCVFFHIYNNIKHLLLKFKNQFVGENWFLLLICVFDFSRDQAFIGLCSSFLWIAFTHLLFGPFSVGLVIFFSPICKSFVF